MAGRKDKRQNASQGDDGLYRHLFDSLADAIFVIRQDNLQILDANRQAVALLGYSKQELLQMTYHDIVVLDVGDSLAAPPPNGVSTIVERVYRAKSGEHFWAEVNGSQVDYTGHVAILCALRDIRRHKQTGARAPTQKIQVDMLQEATRTLNSSLNLIEITGRLLDYVARVIPIRGANIMTVIDDDTAQMLAHWGHEALGIDTTDWLEREWDFRQLTAMREVIATRRPLVIADTQQSALWLSGDKGWSRSYLGVPIMAEGDVLGVLNVGHEDPDMFTDTDAEYVLTFAHQAGIAIRNARLHETIQQAARELEERVTLRTVELRTEISRRRKIESELEEERNLLRRIIDCIPDEIYVKDLEGRITLANKALEHRVGYCAPGGQVVGSSDLDYMTEAQARHYRTHELRLVRGEIEVVEDETEIFDKDKRRQWLSIIKVVLRDINDEVTGIVGINRNVTDLKQAEETLQQANELLEQRVVERTTELLNANRDLIQQIRERERAERSEREQRLLAESLSGVSAALSESLDLDAVLDRILVQAGRVVPPHENASIQLIEEDIYVRTLRGRDHYDGTTKVKSMGDRFFLDSLPTLRKILETGSPVVIPDTRDNLLWTYEPERAWLRSYIGVPIHAEGKVIGFLNLGSKQPGQFTPHHAQRLLAFSDQAGVAIRNARLFKQVRTYASEMQVRVAEQTRELERERAQLHAILDSMTDGVVYYDDRGRPQYVNRALLDQTGYTVEEWLGNPIGIWAQLSGLPEPEARREVIAVQHNVLRNGLWHSAKKFTRKNGEHFDVELVSTTVQDFGGQPAGIVTVMRDVSAAKRLEEQKARFIATASHELRTPIANIKTRLYLLKRQPDKMQAHLDVIDNVTERMHKIVNDLLDISRFQYGVIVLQRKNLLLQDLLSGVIQVQHPDAERKHITVREHLPEDRVIIWGDHARITQVFTNLLTNAIHYTPEDGEITVRLGIWTEVGEEGEKQYADVEIEDTGGGIPEVALSQIFDPFFRVNDYDSGVGLGLSITREIVELHGGTIQVHNLSDVGARFTVRLPVTPLPPLPSFIVG